MGTAFLLPWMGQLLTLNGQAVSVPPIFGESPVTNKDKYYPKKPFILQSQVTHTFGCAANFSQIRDPKLAAILEKIIPRSKTDKDFEYHTHSLSLKAATQDLKDIVPENVNGVFHTLMESTITYADLQIVSLLTEMDILEVKR